MNSFELAVVMFTDYLMEVVPSGTDHACVKEAARMKIQKALQEIKDKFEGKE